MSIIRLLDGMRLTHRHALLPKAEFDCFDNLEFLIS